MATFITTILIIAGGIAALIAYGIIQRKKTDRYIRESYGQSREDPDDIKERMGLIEQLYLTESEDIPEEEQTDDITWDDLSMDDIFAVTDHTDCSAGEQYLYSRLRCPFAVAADRDAFEERIRLFDGDEEKRFAVRKKLHRLGKNVSDYDIPLLSLGMAALKIKSAPLCLIMCIVLILSGVAAAVTRSPQVFTGFVGVYLLNMVTHIIIRRKTADRIKMIFGIGRMLNTADAVNRLAPDSSAGEKLASLSRAMKISATLETSISLENEGDANLMFAYLLGPFMADIILGARLINEFDGKKDAILDIYRSLGRTDAAIAVGSFRKSAAVCCVSEHTEEDRFSFEGVVHPLLKAPVPNDIAFERNMIVTGSNASGKSTFIKAVAVNLLLGQTINTCTAKKAVIPACGVMTSMAVRDDVLSGESYYIREIRYLKRMADLCERGRLLFFAVDEILKGTNTAERIAASKAILEYLGRKRCMMITATHDLELAEAFDGISDNVHFSEELSDSDVKFDYTLRRGISTSTNAIKLLRVTGFPEEIISRAEEEKAQAQ